MKIIRGGVTSLKAKQFLTVCLLGTMIMGPIAVHADTIESLEKQEDELLQQSQTISADVQSALDSVNQKYQEVETLKEKISENEETLADTQEAIETTEETIEHRKEIVAERLKSLQLNRANENKVAILLQSSSIQEFISGLYAMTMLQSAEKEEILGLQEETVKLQELEEKVTATQEELKNSETALVEEADALDSEISTLQNQLANNETALAEISKSKAVETQRLEAEAEREAAEKAAAEEEAKRQEEAQANQQSSQQASQNESASTNAPSSSNDSNNSSSNTSTPPAQETTPPSQPKEEQQPSSNGRVLYVEATAYSYTQAGLSYYTATGIDLRQNSQVIAVDPSVIPLGSLVEVQGYGIAIAGDTGGAIKGNKIDLHMTSEKACYDWGRRYNIKVTILD